MDLTRHVELLLGLRNDQARSAYFDRSAELRSDEGAQILCRSAVALLYRETDDARRLCKALTVLCRMEKSRLRAAYRDHAWAALYHHAGIDYQKAFLRWKRALAGFEAAGRDDEAAITRSCALQTLIYVNHLDLFWDWQAKAHLFFERSGDRLRLARLRSNVAAFHAQNDDWSEAAKAYELAHEDFAVAGNCPQDLATVFNNLCYSYQSLGDLPRAALFAERGRDVCEDAGLNRALAQFDLKMANVRCIQGNFTDALALVRSAEKYYRQNGLRRDSSTAALEEAEILRCLCLFREARGRAAEALAGFADLGLTREQGQSLMTLGSCARVQGRHRKALELYARAKRLFDDSANLPNAQLAALHQATSIFEDGNYELSATLTRQLLDSLPRNPSNPTALKCRVLLSRILLERGELSEAQGLVEIVLARASFLDLAPLEAEARHLLGRVHERSGDPQKAYDAYLRCERCIERLRRQLVPGELKTSFLSDKTHLYEDLFSIGAQLSFSPSQCFDFAEKAKSRTLAELLGPRLLSSWGPTPDADSAELLRLWSGLRLSAKQIEDMTSSKSPHAARRVSDLRQRVAAAERAMLRLMEEAASRGNVALSNEPLPSAQQVVSSLPEQTALVEYYFARGTVFAFYFAAGICDLVSLGEVRRIERLHRLVMLHLRTRPPRGESGEIQRRSLMEHLQELYDLLWLPLEPYVQAPRLVVVPHGLLHQFPFHALFDGHRFLLDRYAISYSPSAGVFHATRSRRCRGGGSGSLVVGSSDENAPEISAEVRDVSSLLGDARVFLDGKATKSSVIPELPWASLIHIAAHGAFFPAEPSASGFRLADGLLTVREIQELRLNAELVVLSGCQTGRSTTNGSDEILGLTQALLQAGACSALVSLWNVEDKSTADFMRCFYSHLVLTENRADALRTAQIAYQQLHGHPYFWAPFVLVGDPESTSNLLTARGPSRRVGTHTATNALAT